MTIILVLLAVSFVVWLVVRFREKSGKGGAAFDGKILTYNGPMTDAYFRTMNRMREEISKRREHGIHSGIRKGNPPGIWIF